MYNRDFVKENFDGDDVKGVFTLGKDNVEVKRRILNAKDKIENLDSALQNQSQKVDQFNEQLSELEGDLKETCWRQKDNLGAALRPAYSGYLNSKEQFKLEVLRRRGAPVVLPNLEELTKQAQVVFGAQQSTLETVPILDCADLTTRENDRILDRAIVGKKDVDIAAMIERLGNSDWVRLGSDYLEDNQGVCPFCQQQVSKGFESALSEYFDETFERETRDFGDFVDSYERAVSQVQGRVAELLASSNEYLDVEALAGNKRMLDAKVTVNLHLLESKRSEPSKKVKLDSLGDVLGAIGGLIAAANDATDRRNQTIENIQQERAALKRQAWSYLVQIELRPFLEQYETSRTRLETVSREIQARVVDTQEERQALETEVRALEHLKWPGSPGQLHRVLR